MTGRRRALVGIRRPVVERHGGDLEEQAHGDQRQAHGQRQRQRLAAVDDAGRAQSAMPSSCVEPVKPSTKARPKSRMADENEPSRKYLMAPSVERASRLAKPAMR